VISADLPCKVRQKACPAVTGLLMPHHDSCTRTCTSVVRGKGQPNHRRSRENDLVKQDRFDRLACAPPLLPMFHDPGLLQQITVASEGEIMSPKWVEAANHDRRLLTTLSLKRDKRGIRTIAIPLSLQMSTVALRHQNYADQSRDHG